MNYRIDAKLVGVGGAKGRVSFDDDRERIELEYRLERRGDAMVVVKVFENEGSWANKGALGLLCCFGIPVGTVGLGLGLGLFRWLFRRR